MIPPTSIQSIFGGPKVPETLGNADSRENREEAVSELQRLGKIMEKNPELAKEIFKNIETQIALISNMPPSVTIKLREARQRFEEGLITSSQKLVDELEGLIDPEEIPESQIKEHAEKADAYLENTRDKGNSVLNTTSNIQRNNPFYGDLQAPALIRYRRENEEKNYTAEYAQSALKGLPIYKQDEQTPKIYTAVAPNGGEKRIIYWIPNNSAIKNFEGHWAMKGQMPDQTAFIPDGWTIHEIEKPEEMTTARQEIAQEEPKIQKEQQEIDTAMQNPETKKETAKKLAARLTETLQKEMQSAEKSQQGMTEAFLICFNAHFSVISKPAEIKKPETAKKAVPQTTAVSVGETAQQEIATAESEMPEIQEQEGMRYITHLFSTIQEAEQEKQPEEAQKEAMEAVITLEEIFASIEISTTSEKTVPMNELLATGQTTTPEQESIDVEIETLRTNTLKTLQHMRLAFE